MTNEELKLKFKQHKKRSEELLSQALELEKTINTLIKESKNENQRDTKRGK